MKDVTPKTRKQKVYFTALRIAYIAIFTTLSVALRFWQFPIFETVKFLEFDFSDIFVLISGYALGPVSGVIVGIMKELIYGLTAPSKTFMVGELANIVILIPFVLLTSLMYKKRKGIKSVIFWMVIACLMRTVWSFPTNLFLNFPIFLGFNWEKGMSMFWDYWYWVMLFNLIKSLILAVVALMMYKSVSRIIHIINNKIAESSGGEVEQTQAVDAQTAATDAQPSDDAEATQTDTTTNETNE